MFAPLSIVILLGLASPSVAMSQEETAVESKDLAPLPVEKAPDQLTNAVLQGLNKVTGQISRLEGPSGSVMRFGTLEIAVHRCWKSSPEEQPENAALLEISELKPSEAPQRIFLGWMFSSTPGLSGLEHPVYDITVLACNLTEPEKPKEEKKENKKE